MLQLLVIQSRVDAGSAQSRGTLFHMLRRPAFQQILAISDIVTKLLVVRF
jgi:hypothetical protein